MLLFQDTGSGFFLIPINRKASKGAYEIFKYLSRLVSVTYVLNYYYYFPFFLVFNFIASLL